MTIESSRRRELSAGELTRYSRHLLLPEVGVAGQQRLRDASVLVVGAGGLGSPAALYLAAAGVGTLGILDGDRVDLTNLQRQIVHSTSSVGQPKTASAAERLGSVNPEVSVVAHQVRLSASNALDLLRPYDVVVDGTDNFPTRYLVNDACVLLGKPNVYGSVLRFEGQVTVFGVGAGPCYRCLFPTPPAPGTVPGCAEAGVLGVLPGLIGVIQATEALKMLLGIGDGLAGRLLLVDALRMRFRTITVSRVPTCPACGTRELSTLSDYDAFCGTAAKEKTPASTGSIRPKALHARLAHADLPPPFLLDVREAWEWGITHLPGARLIPLGMLDDMLGALDPTRETVVYCHHGLRSRAAAEHLAGAGFSRVYNLEGGLAAWRDEIDPEMPGY